MPELDEKVKSANCNKKKLLSPCHNINLKYLTTSMIRTLLCYISLYIEMYIDDNLVGRLNKFKVPVVRDIMSVTRARLGTPFVPSYFSTRFIKCSFCRFWETNIILDHLFVSFFTFLTQIFNSYLFVTCLILG